MSGSDFEPLARRLEEAAAWVSSGLDALSMLRESPSRLPELARYPLAAGGKRVRPFLVRTACLASGGDPARALGAAVAVEMVHTYSLVHDDLPMLDDDCLRRGLPTLHTLHGTPRSVLAGDLLLVEAFAELLLSPLPPQILAAMAERLARAAGPSRLVGGQYMDMNPPPAVDRPWVERMILGKTAAMIRVSLELGCMSAGRIPPDMDGVSAAGDRLGLLFQLTDDILDVRGTASELGKSASKDAAQGKANLVALAGLEAAEDEAASLSEEVANLFEALDGDWGDAVMLARFLPLRRS